MPFAYLLNALNERIEQHLAERIEKEGFLMVPEDIGGVLMLVNDWQINKVCKDWKGSIVLEDERGQYYDLFQAEIGVLTNICDLL